MLSQKKEPNIRRYGLPIAILATLAAIVISFWQLTQTWENSIRQTRFVATADRYLSNLKDLETAYRGYVVVGDQNYLQPFVDARNAFDSLGQEFRRAGADAGVAPASIDAVIELAQSKRAFAERVVEARDRSFEAARNLMATGQGRDIMDGIRARIDAAQVAATRRADRNAARQTLMAGVAVAATLILIALLAYVWRMSARSRAETNVARQLLNDIFERAQVGLALIDRTGVVRLVNPAFNHMAGVEAGKAVGVSLATLAPTLYDDLATRVRAAIQGRLSRRDSFEPETSELERGGETRAVMSTVFPVNLPLGDESSGLGVGLVMADITKQRETERLMEIARDEAEAANRAKSAFIANMSHELRTPLTAVLGYCELIEDELIEIGQTDLLEDLRKIIANARHLLGLINDVLDLSKIEAQKMDVHAIDFTVDALLADVESMSGGLAQKNNTFTFKNDAPGATLHTDELKLKQILLNLVGNAAKFTENGRVTVRAAAGEKDGLPIMSFSVSDTGIGMTPEHLSRLFQRFSQADETTTRRFGGTGLGLALTKALVQMLGGCIEVQSEVGKGTTFTVHTPVNYAKRLLAPSMLDDRAKGDATPGAMAPRAMGSAVLVVDDDASARELLNRHLVKEGFDVVFATDGIEALQKARDIKPLAILLDVMLPGLDGWHVMRELRADPDTREIPVIIQTVLNEESFAYALGADLFLKKPVNRGRLSQALHDVAENLPTGHVLVIDDDAGTLERLGEMLRRHGWSVSLKSRADEALELMTKAVPDVILIDLNMPGMDGYAFIRAVKGNEQWASIPIVVLTAEDIGQTRIRKLAPSAASIEQKGARPLNDLVADLKKFADMRNRTKANTPVGQPDRDSPSSGA